MKKLLYTIPILVITSLVGYVYHIETNVEPTQPVASQEVVELPKVEPPTVERLLELTNAERVKAGVKPLVLDERLNQSAQKKADTIVAEGNYSHVDTNGIYGIKYIEQYQSKCNFGGEILNNNSFNSNKTIESWMQSPTHRAVIIDNRYEYAGVGLNSGFAVIHFCDI